MNVRNWMLRVIECPRFPCGPLLLGVATERKKMLLVKHRQESVSRVICYTKYTLRTYVSLRTSMGNRGESISVFDKKKILFKTKRCNLLANTYTIHTLLRDEAQTLSTCPFLR